MGENGQTQPRHRAARRGSALVITLLLLALVTMELAMLSIVLTRGLGDEGILVSQNIAARRAAEVALNRLSDRLYHYLLDHPPTRVDTDFSRNGAMAIRGEILTVTNPEGGKTEMTGVTLHAWIKERRGHYYHLVGQGKMGRINLVSHRWVKMNPCGHGGRDCRARGY